jgi:hypothetical protein
MISMWLGIAPALAQTSDITGWHGVLWGSSKSVFRKALGCDPSDIGNTIRCAQDIWLRDCNPVPISSDPGRRRREQQILDMDKEANAKEHKCEPSDVEQFQIDYYPVNHIYYDVSVVFAKAYGLAGVVMTYADSDPSAYQTALAELTSRYGTSTPITKDGRIEWMWVKTHGNLIFSVYQDGGFNILYTRKKDNNVL